MSHRLLVADDNATHRLVVMTFATEPVEVIAVSDGEQARQRLRRERPDIVLAATGLPRIDGYALAEFVQQEPALAGVPVLLLASPFDAVDQERLQRSGAAGVLVKPLEPDAVGRWVRDLLGRSGGHTAVARQTAGDAGTPPPGETAPGPARDLAPASWPVPPLPGPAPLDLDELSEALAQFDVEASPRAAPRDLESGAGSPFASAPGVADAFDALLAAEQSGHVRSPAQEVSDAEIDRIAARVLDRLHERVPAAMIREIVTNVAERLVREEIARIRARARAATD